MKTLFTLFRLSVLAARRRAWLARRDHRSAPFLFYSAVAGLGDLALIWLSFTLVATLALAGASAAALVVAAVSLVLGAPGPLARHLAIPRGDHVRAYWLVMLDELGREHSAHPARIAAARAAARVGSPPAAVAWLQQRRPARLDATEVAVQAILAHGRGDHDDARALFTSIAGFLDPAPEAREIAAEWLALDDARRGAWSELVARGKARARPGRGAHRTPAAIRKAGADAGERTANRGVPLWPATSMTFLLEGVGARMLGHADAPSQLGLWLRWLEAPSRAQTFALVRRAASQRLPRRPATTASGSATGTATATGSGTTTATGSGTATATGSGTGPPLVGEPGFDALAVALRTHARAIRLGTADAIAAAAQAWDATVKPSGLAVAVARRAIAIGAPVDAADRALVELDEQVTAELATLIEQRGLTHATLQAQAPGSAMLGAIGRRARRELLTRLELTCDRIGDRARDSRTLDAVDELRTFAAVRRVYEQAAVQGGPELERLAFPHVHGELLTWTVYLWNDRQEHFLSHLVTSWLYERALAVGDAEAIELHGTNGAIAIPAL